MSKYRMHRKFKKYHNNDFFIREQELNRLINSFIYDVKHLKTLNSITNYNIMDKKRLEIKRLLLLQSSDLWQQSRRRKRFYYLQQDKFKYFYTMWKHITYYTYLHARFDMPLRFIQPLKYYKNVSNNISHTIFNL